MATLVLSTIGMAIGGPVGSAIGALIGQSIDQELLAPTRRGPRVGDLTVQTSSYGTQIPRIYGTMRVAGTVIWSTDLIEHSNTDGAKGQPDVTYNYTVSLAVALSSRPAKAVKRIWADGKLLRGAAGDFKVGTSFRFYDGSQDQIIDPLIGSIEGIANTPGYRGVVLAVFEGLELAEFGNRIPFLTFELEADHDLPTVGSVLSDASSGMIACEANATLAGFAAYGGSIRSAVEPLVESFGVELFDDGVVIRARADNSSIVVSPDDLGNSANGESVPRFHREQLPVRSVPAALRLTYYDADRDYQTGEARAVASEDPGRETQQELPVVLTAADAKSLAQQMLCRAWAERDKLTLRLPPARLGLEPGSSLELPLSPPIWIVDKATVDGFVVVAELRPSRSGAVGVAADGGRIVGNSDVVAGEVVLATFDIPNVLELPSSDAAIIMAASTPGGAWRQRPVEVGFGGQSIATQTARAKSVLGSALTALAAGGTDLIDDQSSVDVELLDADQWLTSCDDEALAAGTNLAVVGSELIQFGRAVAIGEGQFRLTHLLRGRGGTEWACAGHTAGDAFCLVQATSLQAVVLPYSAVGATVTAAIRGGAPASIVYSAEGSRPPSPVDLRIEPQPNGDLALSWIRRSRLGFAWVDEIDAPLGETQEQYRVAVTASANSIELVTDQPTAVVTAEALTDLGAGPAVITVRQIGDFAASKPAQLDVNLP